MRFPFNYFSDDKNEEINHRKLMIDTSLKQRLEACYWNVITGRWERERRMSMEE